MSPPDSKFSPLQSKERGICRDAGIGQKTNGHKYSSIAQSVEHSAVNRRVTGSSPVGGATSERVTLVPIFYCIKNPTPAPLFLLVSQKVTLRLCCSLVNALTTLRLATNFLRYRMVSLFSILYGEEAAAVCFNSALLSVLLSEKGRRAAGGRGSAASRQAKRRPFPCKARKLARLAAAPFPRKALALRGPWYRKMNESQVQVLLGEP